MKIITILALFATASAAQAAQAKVDVLQACDRHLDGLMVDLVCKSQERGGKHLIVGTGLKAKEMEAVLVRVNQRKGTCSRLANYVIDLTDTKNGGDARRGYQYHLLGREGAEDLVFRMKTNRFATLRDVGTRDHEVLKCEIYYHIDPR